MAIERIINIRVLSDEALRNLGQVESQLKENRDELKRLNKAYKDGTITLEEYGRETARLRNENRQLGRSQRLLTREAEATEGSYNALSAEMARLKEEQKSVNVTTEEGAREFAEYAERINEINQTLTDLDAQNGVHTRNVGNYSAALEGLTEQVNALGFSIGGMSVNIGQIANGLNAVTGASQGTSRAMKVLRTALISTGIGAIVVALGSLVAFLTKTKEGSEELSKALAFLSGATDAIIGAFASMGKAIFEAFQNPKEAINSLWETIKQNLINRVEAIPVFFENVFNTVVNSFQFLGAKIKESLADVPLIGKDIDAQAAAKDAEKALNGIKESAQAAGKALIQMNTGLDEDQQKNLIKGFEELGEQIEKAGNAAVKIQKLEIALKDLNRATSTLLVTLQAESELQTQIADDTTKSFKEREAAAEQARVLFEKAAATELRLARLRLQIENQRLAQAKANGVITDEILDAQVEALNAVKKAENDLLLQERENDKQRAELRQDRLERDLDILIDGFDNQKSINERIIADEKRVFEERKALLEETKQLSDDSFNEQIATIQKLTEFQIDANDLIATSDARVLNEKIRALELSEIIEGRLLEIIRDRRTANQDLAEAEKELNEDRVKAIIDANNKIIQDERLSYDTRLEALTGLYEQSLITLEEYNNRVAELDQQRLDARVDKIHEWGDAVQTTIDAVSMSLEASANNRISSLNRAYDAEIEKAKGNEALIKQIEKRKADDTLKIQKDLARKQKRIDIAQASINGALAITKTIAELGGVGAITPAGAAIIAATSLSTAAQIALIESQEFASGGLVRGPGTGTSDSIPARLSNGESVINARSTAMFAPILSAINQAGGGVAFGPSVPSTTISNITNQVQTESLAESFDKIKIVLPVPSNIQVTDQLNALEASNTYVG